METVIYYIKISPLTDRGHGGITFGNYYKKMLVVPASLLYGDYSWLDITYNKNDLLTLCTYMPLNYGLDIASTITSRAYKTSQTYYCATCSRGFLAGMITEGELYG